LPDLKTVVVPPKWKMAIASFIGAYPSIGKLVRKKDGRYLVQ
jgi:hypothetical protein